MADVTTDDSGRFEIPAMAAGPLTFRLSTPHESELRFHLADPLIVTEGDTKELLLSLEPTVLVRGQVRVADTDRGLAGVEIALGHGTPHQMERAISDANGRFEGRVRPGHISVQLISFLEGYTQLRKHRQDRIHVPTDANEFDLPPSVVLAQTEPLDGTLLNADGQPLPHSFLYLEGGSGAVSDAQGKFTMRIPKDFEVEGGYAYTALARESRSTKVEQRQPLIVRVIGDPLPPGEPPPPKPAK